MNQTDQPIQSHFRDVEDIRDLGHFDGINSPSPNPRLERIRAGFEKSAAEAESKSLEVIHEQSAKLEKLKGEEPEATEHWNNIRSRIGMHPPGFVLPTIYALFGGIIAPAIDSFVLGPALDMLGIVNRTLQLICAFGISATAAVSLGLVQDEELSGFKKTSAAIASMATVAFLVLLGILRLREMKFAAALEGDDLAKFWNGIGYVGHAFFMLIALALPIGGAVALHFAVERLRDRLEWQQAKGRNERVSRGIVDARAAIQKEKELLPQKLKTIQAEATEWANTYLAHYGIGATIGSRKPELWEVILKAAAVGGTVFLFLLLVHLLLQVLISLPLAVLVGAIAIIPTFFYWNHRRLHPTPAELRKRHHPRHTRSDGWQPKTEQEATARPHTIPVPTEHSAQTTAACEIASRRSL